MSGIPGRARPFVFLVCAFGALSLLTGVFPWHSSHSLLFPSYLLLTIAASALKTVLPASEGTVSVNFVFFLVGVCNMTISETLALALVATVVQCFWRLDLRGAVQSRLPLAASVAVAGGCNRLLSAE